MALALQDCRYIKSKHSDLNEILKERYKKERERSTVIENWNTELLQQNLLIEIFSWLPVKALLQFKTVCKSWHTIITSPYFISKHLKNYYKNNDGRLDCLLVLYSITHAELSVFELLVDERRRVIASEELDDIPLEKYICGPCDGIYYLYNPNNVYFGWDARALWNPATNEKKVLPPLIMKPNLPSNLMYLSWEFHGFGFDPVNKEYRVVVVNGYCDRDDNVDSNIRYPLSLLVYSLRTDSWRYWGDLAQNYDLKDNKCYICVDGCLYWLGSYEEGPNTIEVIVSFDMGNDACKEINVPNYEQPADDKCLGVYHDSIAFYTIHATDKQFDIWSLDEGLWTKTFTMGPILNIWNIVGHWNDNKIILERDDTGLLLLDPDDEQQLWDLGFRWCGTSSRGIFAYKESMVSFKKGNYWGQDDKTEINSD